VNKVFLTGTVQRLPKVAYTPKGKKILLFPLHSRDSGFDVDVLFSGERYPSDLERTVGGEILVAGTLTRAKTGTDETFKIEASQILWMEE
jgi:primosomal replication protein N